MSDASRPPPTARRPLLGRLGLRGAPRRRRGGLFGKYALLIAGLVGLALLLNGALDLWFGYRENEAALFRIQQEKAEGAARRIGAFIEEIERQIGWTTHAQWAAQPIDQRRFDYFRLLRQAPAITELVQLDGAGKEELRVSRLAMDAVGGGKDLSQSPAFVGARQQRVWLGPVYFSKESEPYITLAMAQAGRNAGVTIAEVNLKLISDVVNSLKVGEGGYAYVVDRGGRLIAHPDISLVLRDTDLSQLPQVAAALAEAKAPTPPSPASVSPPSPAGGGGSGFGQPAPAVMVARSLGGKSVLSAHAAIVPLGWTVFVEAPTSEALAPLYAAALRTAGLLLLALALAALAALFLARRMTGPIRQLQAGAARIGAGELDRRIDVDTGDELEDLARGFNRMAGDLQESYAGLEKKVADRTAELKESLDRQTATAEVLGVINSSPGDLTPVFDAMLEKALRLCEAALGQLWSYGGDWWEMAASRGVSPQYAEFLQGRHRPGPETVHGRMAAGKEVVNIPDIAAEEIYRSGDPHRKMTVEAGGARSMLAVSLRQDQKLLGILIIYRQEVRPFSDKQIAVLQNFAAQAVIAIENARLLTETREALEQQTATAEVLGVINSSPGDLAPVFEAILAKAHALCAAPLGSLVLWDGNRLRALATRGYPQQYDTLARGGFSPTAPFRRLVSGEPFVRRDAATTLAPGEDDPMRRAAVEIAGIRSALFVPLRKDGAVLGYISAQRQEVRPFSDKQITLLQNFAAQAVIAIENARLLTETREALAQQTATAEVLQVINASPGDLAPVFDAMLERAVHLCEFDLSSLWTFDGSEFHPVAKHGVPERFWQYLQDHTPPVFARALAGERFVHIPDVQRVSAIMETDFARGLLALGLEPPRSLLIVSLRKDDALLGVIVAYRREVRPFSDKQIALLQNFAAQAVIAMENARLLGETREALEQQTATAEVLGVINASPGDLTPVFEAILEKAHSLCGVAYGSLHIYDGERFHAAATHNLPEEFVALLRQGFRGADNPVSRPLLDGARLVHIADLAEIEDPTARAAVELGGIRTALFLPLRRDDALLGMIVSARPEVRLFADREIALLQNFSAQAVIAMENARLLTETREALEQQTATAEVLQVINSSPGDLAPVFEAILEKAHTLCGAAHGVLTTYDGEYFRAVALRDMPEPFGELLRQPFRPPPGGAQERLLQGERLIHLLDAPAVEPATPIQRAAVEAGIRTLLMVPLRKDDALLGYITAHRREVRPFTDQQIALLENFAAQAVIAIENARLLTETREALDQQTATAEVLQVINSSPGDLAPVFDTMLEKALHLCQAEIGTLWIYDGQSMHAAAVRGAPPPYAEFLSQGPHPPSHRHLLSGEPAVQIADITETEGYRSGDPLPRAVADLGGVRTLLAVPLRKDEAMLGVFSIYRQEVRPFAEKQIALLQNFAAQAVIAIENARLLTETREALEQQTATAEVLQVINSSPGDLAPVFDAMLEKALALSGAAFGALMSYDGEHVRAVSTRGFPPELVELFARPFAPRHEGDGPYARFLRGEALLHIPDMAAEDVRASLASHPRALVEIAGARTGLELPLRKDDVLLGSMWFYRQEVRPFTDKQIALLQNFAAQAVMAIENARLLTETREALEQQTATAEVLGVINSSPGDLGPVFDAILEKAHTLCGAAHGSLTVADGEYFRAVAMRGMPGELAAVLRRPFRPGRLAELAGGDGVVHIADLTAAQFSSDDPIHRAATESAGVRTLLAVALRKDDVLLGYITANRQEVRPFTDKQIALLKNFAAQAVIAMENVRLITELREALEYQTAVGDVLKVISRSAFDLDAVLQEVVTTAMRLCRADSATIYRNEGGEYRWAVGHMLSPEYEAIERNARIRPGAGTVAGRAALEGRTVQILDAWTDPSYEAKEDARVGGVHTMIGVPLLREGAPIGVVGLARRRIEAFSEREIALVTTFADQAVIAIENARLFDELRARTAELGRSVDELRLLGEVGQAVSSTLDLRAVLSTILTRSVGLTGADAGAVFRYGRAERSFRLVEAFGWDEALLGSVGELHVPEAETAMGEAAARRVPIQLADLADRPSAALRDASLAAGFRGVLIVPLVGPERILGAMVLQRRAAGEFPAETVRLMQTLASQSVLAIQNARLFREIAEKSEELALASEHKSQFLANMSHELRTPLNAILGYAELLVDGIYGVLPERAQGVLERVQNNGRHLLALINDVLDLARIEAGQLTLTLEDYSLPELVRGVVVATEPLAAAKGLHFAALLQDNLPLAHGDARRVSQVLLNLVGNAIKFTDTGEVEIRAAAERGQFVLSVRDTGPGIADADQDRIFGEFQQIDNTNTRRKGGTGLGLAISKRMVEMQGGMISVDSVLGEGSTFRVVLPVRVEPALEEAAE